MLGLVREYQYINIAVLPLLAAGKGAKEPCLHDGLRLEVLGYLPADGRCFRTR